MIMDIGARALSDLRRDISSNVSSNIGAPELDTTLGSVQAESSVGDGGVVGGRSEEVREGGAASAIRACSAVSASNSGCGSVSESIHVRELVAGPDISNISNRKSDVMELNWGTDGGSS
jgi:hypothetical protein